MTDEKLRNSKPFDVADYEYYKDKPECPFDGNIIGFKTKMAKRAATSSIKEMMKKRKLRKAFNYG